jgi:hypothetical protein
MQLIAAESSSRQIMELPGEAQGGTGDGGTGDGLPIILRTIDLRNITVLA